MGITRSAGSRLSPCSRPAEGPRISERSGDRRAEGSTPMARIVRRRTRRRRTSPGTRVFPGALSSEPQELLPPSVLLLGSGMFRTILAPKIADGYRARVFAEVDAEGEAFDPALALRADVVVAEAGHAVPSLGIEVARAMQLRKPAIGVVLVVSRVSRAHLTEYWRELANWSLLTPATCGETGRLVGVVESVANGIRWVDPPIGRVLRQFEDAGGPRAFAEKAFEDLPDFGTGHGDWGGQVRRTQGSRESEGRWLSDPTKVPRGRSVF